MWDFEKKYKNSDKFKAVINSNLNAKGKLNYGELILKGKSKQEIYKIGIEWTLNQVQELIEAKVPCVHFYIMSSAKSVIEVVSKLK